jgi:uncharacterized protein YodC (DUF2158 family)
MAKQWKTGDKVKLATGGPEMTVKQQVDTTYSGEVVECHWFDKDNKLQNAEFAPDELVESK